MHVRVVGVRVRIVVVYQGGWLYHNGWSRNDKRGGKRGDGSAGECAEGLGGWW